MNRIWRGDKSNGEGGGIRCVCMCVCVCVCVSHTPAGWVLLPINWGGVCVNVCVCEASLRHSAAYEPTFDDPWKRVRIRSWSIVTDTAFLVLCSFTVVNFHRSVLWSTCVQLSPQPPTSLINTWQNTAFLNLISSCQKFIQTPLNTHHNTWSRDFLSVCKAASGSYLKPIKSERVGAVTVCRLRNMHVV